MEVHQAGGGIHFTVEHTRAAAASTLLASLTARLGAMLRAGSTLVEVKSGYGLELEAELKMLEVMEEARRTLPISLSSTYCGAHAVPRYSYTTLHPTPPTTTLHHPTPGTPPYTTLPPCVIVIYSPVAGGYYR